MSQNPPLPDLNYTRSYESEDELEDESEDESENKSENKSEDESTNSKELSLNDHLKNRLEQQRALLLKQSSKLTRMHSIEAQTQTGEGTCYAHACARVITRLISKSLPKYFTINETEKTSLRDNNKKTKDNINCFVNTSSKDIKEIRNKLYPQIKFFDKAKKTINKYFETEDYNYSKNKCPIKGKYNTLIIYYYTLLTIKRKYGCNGGFPDQILGDFCNDIDEFYNLNYEIQLTQDGYFDEFGNEILGLNKMTQIPKDILRGFLISKSVDDKCREILTEFKNFLAINDINIDVDEVTNFGIKNIDYNNNWITNFPEDAKKALNRGLYVVFSFRLTEEQFNELKNEKILNVTSNTEFNCSENVPGHSVVITKWEKDEKTGIAYVTIVNSWGYEWGLEGVFKIPSTLYNKFILTSKCKKNSPTMYFNFFDLTITVNDTTNRTIGKQKMKRIPYEFPLVQMGTRTRPKTLSEWAGGKTKKTKKRKNLNKRKSRKRN